MQDLQQANGELQAALAQSENYHEIRHIKDNTTLYQHSKVIELLLQNKLQDGKHKRTLADKLFRSKGKENLNPKVCLIGCKKSYKFAKVQNFIIL